MNLDEVVRSQQKDGFDVGASCGRPCPGERSSPLSRVSRDNDEVEAESRSERDRWTFYETINSSSRCRRVTRPLFLLSSQRAVHDYDQPKAGQL